MLHSRFPFHVSREKSAVQNRWIWSGKRERQVGLGDVIPDLRPTQHLMFRWGRARPVPAKYLSPDPTGATIHASMLFNHLISALSSGRGTAGVEVAGPEGNTSGAGPTEVSDGAIVNTTGHVLLYIHPAAVCQQSVSNHLMACSRVPVIGHVCRAAVDTRAQLWVTADDVTTCLLINSNRRGRSSMALCPLDN
jgi:hypothetical protein